MTTMELIGKGIGHNCLSDAYDLGRAEAIDEFINTIKPRMKWDNDIYTLAIEHCIEVAEMLKERNK